MELSKAIREALDADRRGESSRQSQRALFWLFCIILPVSVGASVLLWLMTS